MCVENEAYSKFDCAIKLVVCNDYNSYILIFWFNWPLVNSLIIAICTFLLKTAILDLYSNCNEKTRKYSMFVSYFTKYSKKVTAVRTFLLWPSESCDINHCVGSDPLCVIFFTVGLYHEVPEIYILLFCDLLRWITAITIVSTEVTDHHQ